MVELVSDLFCQLYTNSLVVLEDCQFIKFNDFGNLNPLAELSKLKWVVYNRDSMFQLLDLLFILLQSILNQLRK